MKQFFTCLLTVLGLNSACGQHNYETTDAEGFSQYVNNPDAVVLDVRGADEYAEGHIEGAVNIDVNQDSFIERAAQLLPKTKTIAVYCRGGRRSVKAADQLETAGFKLVNLKGGITQWKEAGKDVTTDTHETDVVRTPGGKLVKFYALVHASIRIVCEGTEIEVDPVGKMGDRVTDYSSMPKANYIFVTHEHGDHFDKDAIAALTAAGTRLITNQRCADMMGYGTAMANGEQTTLANGIKVEAVPAYNITEGHTQFHPKGRDNGFILTIDELRIYIAGDTEDIPEMADVKNIDVAFLPCNQPYTMTTDQLVKAAKTVKPKILFPYHYGQTDVTGLPSLLEADGIDVRIRHYE